MTTITKLIKNMQSTGESEILIHRIAWEKPNYPNMYVKVNLPELDMWEDDNKDGGGSRNFLLTLEELLAKDWELYTGYMYSSST